MSAAEYNMSEVLSRVYSAVEAGDEMAVRAILAELGPDDDRGAEGRITRAVVALAREGINVRILEFGPASVSVEVLGTGLVRNLAALHVWDVFQAHGFYAVATPIAGSRRAVRGGAA